jgi:hypothetical protein
MILSSQDGDSICGQYECEDGLYEIYFSFFFLVSWGGVRLSPLGTSATDWPNVPAPDDR